MDISQKVFVDSDAYVALSKEDDNKHKKAVIIFNKLLNNKTYFFTSNYVFSEVVTVLSLRLNHSAAMNFIKTIKSSPDFYDIKWVNEDIEEKAIEIFSRQTSKNVSFVDCCNMAVMNIYSTPIIFSFDNIYRKNGYKLT